MVYFAAVVSVVALSISVLSWLAGRRQAHASEVQAAAATRQLALQEDLARAAASPNLWVDIRPDHQGLAFHVVLCNDGPTMARNVRVRFDPPLSSLQADWEMPVPVQIHSLPPGRRMSWFFDVAPARLNDDTLPTAYDVLITADGPLGEVQPLRYRLDLREYLGAGIRTVSGVPSPADEIRHAADKISRTIEARTSTRRAAPAHPSVQ